MFTEKLYRESKKCFFYMTSLQKKTTFGNFTIRSLCVLNRVQIYTDKRGSVMNLHQRSVKHSYKPLTRSTLHRWLCWLRWKAIFKKFRKGTPYRSEFRGTEKNADVDKCERYSDDKDTSWCNITFTEITNNWHNGT